MSSWDYIIIGAGTSGCVLANRLSADPRNKVLLLEAGGEDRGAKYNIVALANMKLRGHAETDWMFRTEPDPSRADRQDIFPRGKVLGGSSSINGTVYVRGNRGDYDHWAQLGNKGWDYDSLIKIFHRIEDGEGRLADSSVYGTGGPMKISETRGLHPLTHNYIAAMAELGAPRNPAYNGENQTGTSVTHVTQSRGWRWSASRGYLGPARSRPNLCVMTGAIVRKVIIEGRRAVGVQFEKDGERRSEGCVGEVIISASSFNSPKLLMLSGIGDPDDLAGHGIQVVHANRNVGRNLQEHAICMVKANVSQRTLNMDAGYWGQLRHGLRFMLFGSGPASHHWPAISFVKLRAESEYPDVQLHFGPFIADVTSEGIHFPNEPGVTILVNANRSQSRGQVRLRSGDAMDPPVIQPNMLGSDYDLRTLMAGVGLARNAFGTKAFEDVFVSERTPGNEIRDDASLEQYVRSTASAGFHPSGTVRMGVDDTAVVDPSLRVIGIDGLRVVDSSIIPQIPSGNINAISLVIGEKGADAILEQRRSHDSYSKVTAAVA